MSWGRPETTPERLLTTLLSPAAALYGVGSYLRLRAYGSGHMKRHKVSVPVVSIGNLTCGGTGKTPVTIDLAQRLVAAGYTVAILSRGYQRKSTEELLVVSDGQGRIASCTDAGDEPYMMAHAVPAARVIVSAKRFIAAEVAIGIYDANIILLDDGFQHLSLQRDHDIVLIDYNDDPVSDSLLPAGRLREPISALTRATWVVITRVPARPNAAKLSYLEELVSDRAERAQITRCSFVPHSLRPLGLATTADSLSSLAGTKVIACSGIARPRFFVDQLNELKAQVVKQRSFGDHHWWQAADIETLRQDLLDTGAELIVTTTKDASRMDSAMFRQLPIAALELTTQWLGAVPVLSAPPFSISNNTPQRDEMR